VSSASGVKEEWEVLGLATHIVDDGGKRPNFTAVCPGLSGLLEEGGDLSGERMQGGKKILMGT